MPTIPTAPNTFNRVLEEFGKRLVQSPLNLKRRLLEELPGKVHFLFEPHPYKVLYGGRYGIKSWSASAAILQLGYERRLRAVCLRETMKSLEDSVHTLMGDQINRLSLQSHYRRLETEIRGANGSNIFYAGLHNNRSISIKSMEGVDIFWVEEAENVSKESWDTLIPTIRKPGAELWVTMNPRYASDDSYKRFVLNPPTGAIVVKTNWRDNKYRTEEMDQKIRDLKASDPDSYEHIYEGACRSTVEDAVYKNELLACDKEGRIRRVPYHPQLPVDTYWDLGWGDMVSIWFVQSTAFEHRFIDYHQDNHKSIDHFLQVMQSKGYTYGKCVLPWDGGVKSLQTGKSTGDAIKAKGFRVELNRQAPIDIGIDAVRTMFPLIYFDATKCDVGLNGADTNGVRKGGLRNYQWGPPAKSGAEKREPLHDAASHPADGLRTFAMHIKTPPAHVSARSGPPAWPIRQSGGSMGWAR